MTEKIEILTVAELAELLRVDARTIYRRVKTKEIPGAFRVGEIGAIRFIKSKVFEWMESQTVYGKANHAQAN